MLNRICCIIQDKIIRILIVIAETWPTAIFRLIQSPLYYFHISFLVSVLPIFVRCFHLLLWWLGVEIIFSLWVHVMSIPRFLLCYSVPNLSLFFSLLDTTIYCASVILCNKNKIQIIIYKINSVLFYNNKHNKIWCGLLNSYRSKSICIWISRIRFLCTLYCW